MKGKVIYIRNNAMGFYGKIQADDGGIHYFDTSCVLYGLYPKKNREVEFDVIPSNHKGKTKAVNVRYVEVDYPILPQEKVEELLQKINEIFLTKEVIESNLLVNLLNGASVDYNTYAESLGSFAKKYFDAAYRVECPYKYEGKTYTLAIFKKTNTIDEGTLQRLVQRFADIVDVNGFFASEELLTILTDEFGIKDYRDYASTMDKFVDIYFNGMFVPRNRVSINGKIKPKIYVYKENADLFQEKDATVSVVTQRKVLKPEEVLLVKEALLEYLETNDFILGALFPSVIEKAGVKNYKIYAKGIEEFIEIYFSDILEMKRNEFINGKLEPSIIVKKAIDESLTLLNSLYQSGDSRAFLSSPALHNISPILLGVEGIQMALFMLADYLGESRDDVILNEFQKVLITTYEAKDIIQYKNNENLVDLCVQSSYLSLSEDEAANVFKNVFSGKNTVNNNWKGLSERFWTAKNVLAVYFTCLKIIITRKGTDDIDTYLEEAKKERRIDKLPVVLKVYTDFVMNGNNYLSTVIKSKIIGCCFVCHDIDTLCKSYLYFDNNSMTKMSEVIEYLEGRRVIDHNDLLSWFRSDFSELVAEKIINYYWWRESRTELSPVLIRLFSDLFWYYPENRFAAILYDSSCPDFDNKYKVQLLIKSFTSLCEFSKEYNRTFLFDSYLYKKYIADMNDPDLDKIWNDLKDWMKIEIEAQLTSELSSASLIRLFNDYSTITAELEEYYCEKYVAETLKKMSTEVELDSYFNQCEELSLYFVIRWVNNNLENTHVMGKERYVTSLIESRNFERALTYIQYEGDFTETGKIKRIKECLCANFDLYGFTEEAYRIFDNSIKEDYAEQILLEKTGFEVLSVKALICIYARRKDWLKALYLYVPFSVVFAEGRRQFIDDLYNDFLSKGIIDKNSKIETHYDIIRYALRKYDSKGFDSFVEWARKINIPANSKKYSDVKKTFDNEIRRLLSEGDYKKGWYGLLRVALYSDNNEKQDYLRFCIIVSFIGRYGIDEFEKTISSIESKKKHYSEYYISLWKGLLSGYYGENFYGLCRPLIGNAPLTFWNIFYDISVCKNHVFSKKITKIELLPAFKEEIQKFYDDVLENYSVSREVVYLKIAASIISEFSEDIIPSFEKYIPFCSSVGNKEFLFVALIRLISEERYSAEISKFLKGNFWKCDEGDFNLIRILQAMCVDEIDELFDEKANFSSEELRSFKYYFLESIKTYPKVFIPMDIRSVLRECRLAYQFKLSEWLLRIKLDKGDYDEHSRALSRIVPEIQENALDDLDYHCYFQLISVLYRVQLKIKTDDIIFIRNRYYRILISKVLLETDLTQFSDDEIVSLMKKHRHFSNVYPQYKDFKDLILDFAKLESISEKLKIIFLTGVLSNNWDQFTASGPEYTIDSLELIKKIEVRTNYRALNIKILQELIYDSDRTPENWGDIEYVKYCSPGLYSVLEKIKRIYEEDEKSYEICRTLITGIAYLDNKDRARKAYDNMKKYLKKYPDEIEKHLNVYVSALMLTSYVKTIINILASEIRQRKISSADVIRWRPVLLFMEEQSVYYYLLALSYAIERNIFKARTELSSVLNADALPVEWLEEKSRLDAYVSGKVRYFTPTEVFTIGALNVEKEAANVSFVNTIGQRDTNRKASIDINDGVKAYSDIIKAGRNMEGSAKYKIYIKLFSYVHSPEELYDIYRQTDSQKQNTDSQEQKFRLTYNELLIEYGSLAIQYNEQLSLDQKMDILIEIFDIYQMLNDINKSKPTIMGLLVSAEQVVLETQGMSFEKWISCKDIIHNILSHEIFACSEADIKKWLTPIDICINIVNRKKTEMSLLKALIDWRDNYYLKPDCSNYENAFVRAVDEKIQKLKKGVNLSLQINNTDIDDGCIFYQVSNISPYSNVSVRLSNSSDDSASVHLSVSVKLGDNDPELFPGKFSNDNIVLRSEETCGQMYRLPEKILEKLQEGSVLHVELNIVYGNKVICNNDHNSRFSYNSYDRILIPALLPRNMRYATEFPAFSASITGFGREDEKSALVDALYDNHLAIIYGPSRVGKSSLLNYLANDYLDSFDDFNGTESRCIKIAFDKESNNEYDIHMITGEPLPEFTTSQEIMDYLFLTPIKKEFDYFDESENEMSANEDASMDMNPFEKVKREINKVFSGKKKIVDKYIDISKILTKHNCQLWLMFDEFQRIVEKWSICASDIAELCTAIRYTQTGSIKLVFCGSDELVRLFECFDDTSWKELRVKTDGTLVSVGQLNHMDFSAMMNDRRVWRGVKEPQPWNYIDDDEHRQDVPDVLRSLWEYTGGNAICGKLLGKEILKKLMDGEYSGRRYLYPADITEVAYGVLNSEASAIKTLLQTHTEKNLQKEKPYLLYIAYEMASDINLAGVSKRKICEFFAANKKKEEEIKNALTLLVARGILKVTENSQVYTFATVYHYDYFKNQATESEMKKIAEKINEAGTKEHTEESVKDQILKKYESLSSPEERDDVLGDIWRSEKDEGVREHFTRDFFRPQTIIYTQGGDAVSGDKNVTLSFQTIIKTVNNFSALLTSDCSSEEFEKAFAQMPGISEYLVATEKEKVVELQRGISKRLQELEEKGDATPKDYEELDKFVEETYKEIEQYSGKAIDQRVKDVSSFVTIDDLVNDNDKLWENLLRIDSAKITKLKNLPAPYVSALTFAVVLHGLFEQIYQKAKDSNKTTIDAENLDFCPVAILYCKIVEAILKQCHTPIYIRRMSGECLKFGKETKFKDLGSPDEFNIQHPDLTIGSYASHLVYLPYGKIAFDPELKKPDGSDYEYKHTFSTGEVDFEENIKTLIGEEKCTDNLLGLWKEHARALKVINVIRNHSSHELQRISKECFDWLIEILFEEGELLRAWELAEGDKTGIDTSVSHLMG